MEFDINNESYSSTRRNSSIEQNLMVCVRIRPVTDEELLHGGKLIAHRASDNMVVLLDPMEDPDDILRANRSRERHFTFDHSFDGSSSQNDVYGQTTRFLIDNVISGCNATVFAYGATGAGKTYTMLGTDEQPGIMYLAMKDLFKAMSSKEDDHYFKVTMSYLEIYNEMIRDLLNPSSNYLDLREDSTGIHVSGLSEVQASSPDEVMELLKSGNLLRTTEPTSANQTSSRSHAVLQIMVQRRNRIRAVQEEIRVGKLYLIDLAGSERAASTTNQGKRRIEGAHINRSLLALGNCINALAAESGNKRYVNYRDSKLTRLLKDSLGGNCRTVMIAHVSPASLHFEESRNTLVYADRAKNIKTKVHANISDVNHHIIQYTNIIAELREEIVRLQEKLKVAISMPEEVNNLEIKYSNNTSEINKLKDQLILFFEQQMLKRRSIMDVDSIINEIKLDYQRNSLIISQWETERVMRLINREEKTEDARIKESEKAAELGGLIVIPDPEEVANARTELELLAEEQHRNEALRGELMDDLQIIKTRTKKIEDLLPSKLTSSDQRELIDLMCRVHQLEIDRLTLQAESSVKEMELKGKDLALTRMQYQKSLCDQIISRQRELLAQGNVEFPKELQEMVQLYESEILNLNLLDQSEVSLSSDPSQSDTSIKCPTRNQENKSTIVPSGAPISLHKKYPWQQEDSHHTTEKFLLDDISTSNAHFNKRSPVAIDSVMSRFNYKPRPRKEQNSGDNTWTRFTTKSETNNSDRASMNKDGYLLWSSNPTTYKLPTVKPGFAPLIRETTYNADEVNNNEFRQTSYKQNGSQPPGSGDQPLQTKGRKQPRMKPVKHTRELGTWRSGRQLFLASSVIDLKPDDSLMPFTSNNSTDDCQKLKTNKEFTDSQQARKPNRKGQSKTPARVQRTNLSETNGLFGHILK